MPLLQHDFSLKNHNSFGIDVKTSIYASPENNEQLSELMDQHDFKNLPYLIIGKGSNLLFNKNFEGLVLNPRMEGIELEKKKGNQVLVRVGAAENWDSWVEHATRKGWFGLENLSLIPGTVGAAPVQNIGAYGVEMKDQFAWLEAWDIQEKKQVRLNSEDCRFSYRNSIFKSESRGRYIITHVAFRLNRKPRMQLDYGLVQEAFSKAKGSTPMDLRKIIINIRTQKLPDPQTVGNAGSFFKNPLVDMILFKCIHVDYPEIPNFREGKNQVKIPAAWLIEQAGWKGKRLGNVGTWPEQPLIIVNYGGATGQEILDFSEEISDDIKKKFGISLEREVQVV